MAELHPHAGNDSLVVQTFVRNTTRHDRQLEGNDCGNPVHFRVRHAATRREWDIVRWRDVRDSLAWEQVRRVRPRDAGVFPRRVCLAYSVQHTIRPGHFGPWKRDGVLVREVLGDSLPEGRYDVFVPGIGSAREAAATVELRRGAPPAR